VRQERTVPSAILRVGNGVAVVSPGVVARTGQSRPVAQFDDDTRSPRLGERRLVPVVFAEFDACGHGLNRLVGQRLGREVVEVDAPRQRYVASTYGAENFPAVIVSGSA